MSEIDAAVLERLRALPGAALLRGVSGVWVVGGAVRDALLGREVLDADYVVEGDAIAVARELALPVLAVHERFGTVECDGFDLASARVERYGWGGELPEVRLGVAIADDLGRRDFTVNAIAVRLEDGAVEAVPAAFPDLAARRLRVLHAQSFVDDPTRLIRLVRYAARLGFEVEEQTALWAEAAVAEGALGTVSGARLGNELRLALAEPQPEALARVWPVAVHPAFAVDRAAVARVVELAADGRWDLAAFAACIRAVPAGELRARLDELAFPAAERDLVLAAAAAPSVEGLREAPLSEVWGAVGRLPLEVLAVAGDEVVLERWREARAAELSINGDDLVAMGMHGRSVGDGLAAARAALLDGRAPDRASQLAAALGAVSSS